MKKVLITAPARQDPKIFKEYRDSIDRLIIPDGYEIGTFFVVNNCPELEPCLRRGDRYVICNTDQDYIKTSDDHKWTLQNMLYMGEMRNRTIQFALDNGYDYWFSVDTDIVLHPETLVMLLSADKDIVSELFYSVSGGTNRWCNAWMYDQYSDHPSEWEQPGLYRCGMTGACMLVKRKVLEAGVNYTRVPNILYSMRGEDRHFCIRAACAGFELWVDTHCTPDHLYTEDVYQEYMRRKQFVEQAYEDWEEAEREEQGRC